MTGPSIVAVDHTFKPGDRVAICTPDEINNSPAWAVPDAGSTGTVIEWDTVWLTWRVQMDDVAQGVARWPTIYLKPHITSIDDVEKYLAAS